jgi:lysophospholipid acyltransferase (LPLAT)-like uncharacterized protein
MRIFVKALLTSFLIRILASTWRVSISGIPPQGASVLAFWHGEMLPIWKYFSRRGAAGLTSLSRDGALLARLLGDWRYELVRGSSSKGAKEALQRFTQLATTRIALITPDGPRGPRHEFKVGAVVAAARAGVPLVLCRLEASADAFWRFERAWDKFCLPKPFARLRLQFSEPMMVSLEDEHRRENNTGTNTEINADNTDNKPTTPASARQDWRKNIEDYARRCEAWLNA